MSAVFVEVYVMEKIIFNREPSEAHDWLNLLNDINSYQYIACSCFCIPRYKKREDSKMRVSSIFVPRDTKTRTHFRSLNIIVSIEIVIELEKNMTHIILLLPSNENSLRVCCYQSSRITWQVMWNIKIKNN